MGKESCELLSREDQIDSEFSQWLRRRRLQLDLDLLIVANQTGISIRRLLELETNTATKGVTQTELRRLGRIYEMDLELCLAYALGKVN